MIGKLGSAFASSNTQHGGQETTIVCGFLPFFLHQGMIVAGLPYSFKGQMREDEITGIPLRILTEPKETPKTR